MYIIYEIYVVLMAYWFSRASFFALLIGTKSTVGFKSPDNDEMQSSTENLQQRHSWLNDVLYK